MDIELHPTVSLQEETLSVLVALPEMLIESIDSQQHIRQYKALFVSGNSTAACTHRHRPRHQPGVHLRKQRGRGEPEGVEGGRPRWGRIRRDRPYLLLSPRSRVLYLITKGFESLMR